MMLPPTVELGDRITLNITSDKLDVTEDNIEIVREAYALVRKIKNINK